MKQTRKKQSYNYENQIRFLDSMYWYLLSICHYKIPYSDIQKLLREVMSYPITIYTSQHTSLVSNGTFRKELGLGEIIGVFKACVHYLDDGTQIRFGITKSKWFLFDCESFALILKPLNDTSSMLIAKKK